MAGLANRVATSESAAEFPRRAPSLGATAKRRLLVSASVLACWRWPFNTGCAPQPPGRHLRQRRRWTRIRAGTTAELGRSAIRPAVAAPNASGTDRHQHGNRCLRQRPRRQRHQHCDGEANAAGWTAQIAAGPSANASGNRATTSRRHPRHGDGSNDMAWSAANTAIGYRRRGPWRRQQQQRNRLRRRRQRRQQPQYRDRRLAPTPAATTATTPRPATAPMPAAAQRKRRHRQRQHR